MCDERAKSIDSGWGSGREYSIYDSHINSSFNLI